MGRLVLSFNTALAAPIRTGYEGIGAGVPFYHFDAPWEVWDGVNPE